jgi:hypothetical protein
MERGVYRPLGCPGGAGQPKGGTPALECRLQLPLSHFVPSPVLSLTFGRGRGILTADDGLRPIALASKAKSDIEEFNKWPRAL